MFLSFFEFAGILFYEILPVNTSFLKPLFFKLL